jgi:hypothetical protein
MVLEFFSTYSNCGVLIRGREKCFSFHRHVCRGPASNCGGVKLTTRLHLPPRLKMRGTIPSHTHTHTRISSWQGVQEQGQIYTFSENDVKWWGRRNRRSNKKHPAGSTSSNSGQHAHGAPDSCPASLVIVAPSTWQNNCTIRLMISPPEWITMIRATCAVTVMFSW